jgi:hypothetical protein
MPNAQLWVSLTVENLWKSYPDLVKNINIFLEKVYEDKELGDRGSQLFHKFSTGCKPS